jgi:hypothetical protein
MLVSIIFNYLIEGKINYYIWLTKNIIQCILCVIIVSIFILLSWCSKHFYFVFILSNLKTIYSF